MRRLRRRWLASASLLFRGSRRWTEPRECPTAAPGKAADLPAMDGSGEVSDQPFWSRSVRSTLAFVGTNPTGWPAWHSYRVASGERSCRMSH
jgi:hypothetical protein